MKRYFIIVLLLTLVYVYSANWPSFQGINRNAVSSETGINKSWDKAPPKELWSVKVGSGFGGPVIRDGKVYLLDRDNSDRENDPEGEKRKDHLICYSLDTGEELWRYSYKAPGKTGYDGSRACPAVDEENVYSIGPFGHIVCVNKETGKLVWKKNIADEYGEVKYRWAMAQNPLLHKDMLIIAPQTSEAFITALNKKNGKEMWIADMEGRNAYASPVVYTIDGVEQILMMSGKKKESVGGIAGFDAATGKQLWFIDDWQSRVPIAHPMRVSDDEFFVTSGYNAGSMLFSVVKNKKGKWSAKKKWKDSVHGAHIHQPLFVNGYIYLISNENARKNGFACLSKEGKLMWKTIDIEGISDFDRGGSLTYIDGVIILRDGHNGDLYMVKPNPKKFETIGKLTGKLSGKQVWAPVAVSDLKMIIRDQKKMKCFDIAAK
jgi:outer membrane protein assembly factor BamB